MEYFVLFKTVSFQTIVATDFSNTYVSTTYADRGMTWDLKLSAGTSPTYPVRVGWVGTDPDATVHSSEYTYSYWDIRTGSPTLIPRIQNIDAYATDGRGRVGYQYYVLTNNDGTFIHPGVQCANWVAADKVDTSTPKINQIDVGKCPCDLTQMTSSWRLGTVINSFKCYLRVRLTQEHTPHCCYDSSGAIVTSPTPANGRNLYQRYSGTKRASTLTHYGYCCSQSYITTGQTTQALCDAFLVERPVSTCNNYVKCKAGNAFSVLMLSYLQLVGINSYG